MQPRTGIPRARSLRLASTDAERHLWRRLRNRQLSGFKFRRQVPLAGYVVDFLCPDAGLIIELDGGQHHDRADSDAIRTESLARDGFRVLRFWNDDALARTEDVLAEILRHLESPIHTDAVPVQGAAE